jgi:nucleotide-binding universal stress UspA family protein
MNKKIVVPLDGSKASEQALPWALELAEKLPADLVLLRVGREPNFLDGQDLLSIQAFLKLQEDTCRNYLLGVKLRLEAESKANVSLEYGCGPASQTILERTSELEANLIVMNSHGRDGMERWWMGSVAEKVTRHASCPVLLVRQQVSEGGDRVPEVQAAEVAAS